jgi:tyrosinase
MTRTDSYTSAPIALPASEQAFTRADLVFYGVDHSGPSFEGRIFFDNTTADVGTPLDPEHGYAGSFHIFGHGGCFGDPGHCAVPERPRDPFDLRPPHQLTPVTKTVIVTDAVRRHRGSNVAVTVVPVVRSAVGRHSPAVLHFRELRLLTYAG